MQDEEKKNGAEDLARPCSHCEEYKAGWQRAMADYLNLQKEINEQKSEWINYSRSQVIEDFLPVYDNFKKAFALSANETNNAWKKGIEFIMKQFWQILEKNGVTEIKTLGEKFEPSLHEIVSEEESEAESGKIIKETEGGYKFGNQVIKVAKVVVSK